MLYTNICIDIDTTEIVIYNLGTNCLGYREIHHAHGAMDCGTFTLSTVQVHDFL